MSKKKKNSLKDYSSEAFQDYPAEAGETAGWGKHLLIRHENLSLVLRTHVKSLDMARLSSSGEGVQADPRGQPSQTSCFQIKAMTVTEEIRWGQLRRTSDALTHNSLTHTQLTHTHSISSQLQYSLPASQRQSPKPSLLGEAASCGLCGPGIVVVVVLDSGFHVPCGSHEPWSLGRWKLLSYSAKSKSLGCTPPTLPEEQSR